MATRDEYGCTVLKRWTALGGKRIDLVRLDAYVDTGEPWYSATFYNRNGVVTGWGQYRNREELERKLLDYITFAARHEGTIYRTARQRQARKAEQARLARCRAAV